MSPAHRISSAASVCRATISALFFSADSFSTAMPSSTSRTRSLMASQRGAQNSSSVVAMTCTSVAGRLNSLAFANVSATSRFTSSQLEYTPPRSIPCRTVPRSIGCLTISGYVGRFSASVIDGGAKRKRPLVLHELLQAHQTLLVDDLELTLRGDGGEGGAVERRGAGGAATTGRESRTDRPAAAVRRRRSASAAATAASSAAALRRSRISARSTTFAARHSMEHSNSANLRLALVAARVRLAARGELGGRGRGRGTSRRRLARGSRRLFLLGARHPSRRLRLRVVHHVAHHGVVLGVEAEWIATETAGGDGVGAAPASGNASGSAAPEPGTSASKSPPGSGAFEKALGWLMRGDGGVSRGMVRDCEKWADVPGTAGAPETRAGAGTRRRGAGRARATHLWVRTGPSFLGRAGFFCVEEGVGRVSATRARGISRKACRARLEGRRKSWMGRATRTEVAAPPPARLPFASARWSIACFSMSCFWSFRRSASCAEGPAGPPRGPILAENLPAQRENAFPSDESPRSARREETPMGPVRARRDGFRRSWTRREPQMRRSGASRGRSQRSAPQRPRAQAVARRRRACAGSANRASDVRGRLYGHLPSRRKGRFPENFVPVSPNFASVAARFIEWFSTVPEPSQMI